jgi:ribosome-associated protein
MPLRITPTIELPDDDIEERFVRASGPGGQNVNKVATAVQLRFDAARSSALDDDVKARLRRLAGTRMTSEGVLVIDARAHRTQAQNREAARDRLIEFIRRASVRPKRRTKTRPTAASRQRRLDSKHLRSVAKRSRRRAEGDE